MLSFPQGRLLLQPFNADVSIPSDSCIYHENQPMLTFSGAQPSICAWEPAQSWPSFAARWPSQKDIWNKSVTTSCETSKCWGFAEKRGTVPDTHKFPLDARIRIASHARIRIASHRIACGEMRACASIRIACAKCAHMRPFASHARKCALMRAFASHARKCAHSHRMRGNPRITTRKTRKWDCGNDVSPSVLVPDPWNCVCSR